METPSELAGLLAHELEAPLLSIELQLRKLLDDRASRRRAECCLDELRALRELVSQLVALANYEPTRQPFALQPVVERVEARFRPVAEERGVRLDVQRTDLRAVGDARATERVLQNLVDNGIKFSRHKGSVRVSARVEGRIVSVEVVDDGPGLEAKDLARLVDPALHSGERGAGHGLGMSIARRFAECQGGTLTLENPGQAGARFALRLEAC